MSAPTTFDHSRLETPRDFELNRRALAGADAPYIAPPERRSALKARIQQEVPRYHAGSNPYALEGIMRKAEQSIMDLALADDDDAIIAFIARHAARRDREEQEQAERAEQRAMRHEDRAILAADEQAQREGKRAMGARPVSTAREERAKRAAQDIKEIWG